MWRQGCHHALAPSPSWLSARLRLVPPGWLHHCSEDVLCLRRRARVGADSEPMATARVPSRGGTMQCNLRSCGATIIGVSSCCTFLCADLVHSESMAPANIGGLETAVVSMISSGQPYLQSVAILNSAVQQTPCSAG